MKSVTKIVFSVSGWFQIEFSGLTRIERDVHRTLTECCQKWKKRVYWEENFEKFLSMNFFFQLLFLWIFNEVLHIYLEEGLVSKFSRKTVGFLKLDTECFDLGKGFGWFYHTWTGFKNSMIAYELFLQCIDLLSKFPNFYTIERALSPKRKNCLLKWLSCFLKFLFPFSFPSPTTRWIRCEGVVAERGTAAVEVKSVVFSTWRDF